MSTNPTPAPSPPAPPTAPPRPPQKSKLGSFIGYILLGRRQPGEVVVVSHSNLFYWWPVWAVGFIMFAITWFHGVRVGFMRGDPTEVTIRGEPVYDFDDNVKSEDKAKYPKKEFHAIITDSSDDPFPKTYHGGAEKHLWPLTHNSKGPGVIFCITLLLVIVITNVPLRGLWSWIIIITIVLGSIIFALAGWWDEIFSRGRLLAVHINAGTYLFISTALFALWFINFVFFDRQHYVAVTAGQVKLKMAIGEGEIVYDTTGMVFQKQRSDLFRHLILGMGSGDLIIRPAGGKDAIDLPNVLFVGSKVREIQELIKEKEVVSG
jgi:hypothetical protein